MQINGLLPIGSVVSIKGTEKRVFIVGVCHKVADGSNDHLYEYVGCPYPEGYLGPDQNVLFDSHQIDKLFALGYQDTEMLRFQEAIQELLIEERKKAL